MAAVAAVLGSVLAMPSGVSVAAASAPAVDPSQGAVTEAQASALAASSGERVEVLGMRGERQLVFARPEGGFTLEQTPDVRRVQQGDDWVDVDTTLEQAPDGSIRPAVAAVDLALSGGGTQPLVKLADNGASVALTFPGRLPAPTLDGDTATYAEVLPGVDLRVQAMPESFSEVLVVKTAEAAQQPALRNLHFAARTTGGVLAAQPDHGVAVVDSTGAVLLDSAQPLAWDSSSLDQLPASAADPEPGERISERTGATSEQPSPAEGDQVAPITATVVAGGLDLAMPTQLLADPNATFPIYLDPTFASTRQRWAMVNKTFPTTAYSNWSDPDQGMGYNSYDGINVKRLFWQFDTKGLAGKIVKEARFTAFETFAANCNTSGASLWRTGVLPDAPTWNNQPSALEKLDTQTLAAGRTNCYPGGTDVTWYPTGALTAAANGSWEHITLGLFADDETTNDGWKRFRSTATLSVDYNSNPDVPKQTEMSTSTPSIPCVTGSSRPYVSQEPALRAVLRDADAGDQLFGTYAITKLGTTTTTINDSIKYTGNPGTASYTPSGLADGAYSWKVRAVDQFVNYSAFSPSCEFQLDSVRPSAPPTITSREYPEDTWAGGVGRQGWFVLGAAGVSDVDRYAYKFQGESDEKTFTAHSLGGTLAVPYTPPKTGPQTLTVYSLDRAGNRSAATEFQFRVRSVDGADTQWEFDSDPIGYAFDTSGRELKATFESTAGRSYTASNRSDDGATRAGDQVLQLNGTTCASTTGAMAAGSGSFTLAAQVKVTGLSARRDSNRAFIAPDGPTGRQIVLGQDGSDSRSVISVGYDGALTGFTFGFRNAEGTLTSATASPADTSQALDASATTLGGWVSLVSAYDASSGRMTLFVNGTEKAAATVGSPLATSGSFWIGCGRAVPPKPEVKVKSVDLLNGGVDDVRVWNRQLSSDQIARIAKALSPAIDSKIDPLLTSGAALGPDERRSSPSGTYDLWMKPDGDLVLTGPLGKRWRSGTASSTFAGASAVMQADGRLILQAPGGSTQLLLPQAPAGSWLQVTDAGGVELRQTQAGAASSTTYRAARLNAGGDPLSSNDELQSPGGVFRLIMQGDGNFVLYGPAGALWSLGNEPTSGGTVAGSRATVKADGNLAVLKPDNTAVFATSTGKPGDHLQLKDDGNVLLYPDERNAVGTGLWSTGTNTEQPLPGS